MDNAYKFEKVINLYLGTPRHLTYASYWSDTNERTSLLFIACLKEYDRNSTGEIGEKLEYFLQNLFNNLDKNKDITLECVSYLTILNKSKLNKLI